MQTFHCMRCYNLSVFDKYPPNKELIFLLKKTHNTRKIKLFFFVKIFGLLELNVTLKFISCSLSNLAFTIRSDENHLVFNSRAQIKKIPVSKIRLIVMIWFRNFMMISQALLNPDPLIASSFALSLWIGTSCSEKYPFHYVSCLSSCVSFFIKSKYIRIPFPFHKTCSSHNVFELIGSLGECLWSLWVLSKIPLFQIKKAYSRFISRSYIIHLFFQCLNLNYPF
jgi:hypothetical protein